MSFIICSSCGVNVRASFCWPHEEKNRLPDPRQSIAASAAKAWVSVFIFIFSILLQLLNFH